MLHLRYCWIVLVRGTGDAWRWLGWARKNLAWPILFISGTAIHGARRGLPSAWNEVQVMISYGLIPVGALIILLLSWNMFLAPGRIHNEQQGDIERLSRKPGRYEHLRKAAQCLVRGYDYGHRPGMMPQEFWSKYTDLLQCGASEPDLRYMAKEGFMEHGEALRRPGVNGVALRIEYHFSDKTLVGLTENGRQWAVEQFGLDEVHAANSV